MAVIQMREHRKTTPSALSPSVSGPADEILPDVSLITKLRRFPTHGLVQQAEVSQSRLLYQ